MPDNKVLELVLKNTDEVVAWACGVCKYTRHSYQEAELCCKPYICEVCNSTCSTQYFCSDCTKKKSQEREQKQYDEAKKVTYGDYLGEWIYCDCCCEYFADVDSFLDSHQDHESIPTWVWGTTESNFDLDAERIISDQLESQDFYEGAFDSIPRNEIYKLQLFMDNWRTDNKLLSYQADFSTVVQLDDIIEKFKLDNED